MARGPKKTAKKKTVKRSFHQDLILNRWLLSFFSGQSLSHLKTHLGDDRFEGIADDGQSFFYHQLTHHSPFDVDILPKDALLRYDAHIVDHWQTITEKRNELEGHVLNMKYFQYLSLLFTEIYLDYYFNRSQQMLDGLNATLDKYSQEDGAVSFQPFTGDDLNKLAFWNATGSGKTLLLHVNIKQYVQYYQAGNRDLVPDKIILLTPNKGLTDQHLKELSLSGFKNATRFVDSTTSQAFKGTIEAIEITKLVVNDNDVKGDLIPISRFSGHNLVLIDEGHRGTGNTKSGGSWMERRAALVEGGFAFEYSATFGQAVSKGLNVTAAEEVKKKEYAKILFGQKNLKNLNDEQLAQLTLSEDDKDKAAIGATREIYAKCILFDYSYKFFYEDGYGKESLILNMNGDTYEKDDNAHKYFTACLLSFYQQLWLYGTHQQKLADFNLEKPLWIFVGHKVNDKDSDILEVITFLAYFLGHKKQIHLWLKDFINDKAQILDKKGNDIFKSRFTPLIEFNSDIDALYQDILRRLFNANVAQRLKLINKENSAGELALCVGDNKPFGLINIGDDAKFFKTADAFDAFDNSTDAVGGALFDTINQADSSLNLLIGSRKFTEGWSSWRVATMGLLNMGQSEGSQIIQLFGRGVRLKGEGFSLKRSTPNNRPKGLHLDKLETLNIFGVRANYMAKFKDYLNEEGVTTLDEMLQIEIQSTPNLPTNKRLKTLALKDGYKDNQRKGFKRTQYPWLYEIPKEFASKIKPPHIELDLYPRIEALITQDEKTALKDARYQGKLDQAHYALFDFERIFLTLQRYKREKTWSNLRLDKKRLIDFCQGDQQWYTLWMPKGSFAIHKFADIRKQEDILIQLICNFTDRFYQALKAGYEGQFFEAVPLLEDNGSMIKLYNIDIEPTDEGRSYEANLKKLQALLEEDRKQRTDATFAGVAQWEQSNMVAISFKSHVFYPMLSILKGDNPPLKMRPLALGAPSEVKFIEDLQAFTDTDSGKKAIDGKSLYLLRNADRKSQGVGFALAGNFYPDFLLWLVDDQTGEQWLTFIDPKGILHMNLNDPKFGLYREIKTIEATLAKQAKPGDPKLTLNAFILSDTNFHDLFNLDDRLKQKDLENKHILFMSKDIYLPKMFDRIGHSRKLAVNPRRLVGHPS